MTQTGTSGFKLNEKLLRELLDVTNCQIVMIDGNFALLINSEEFSLL